VADKKQIKRNIKRLQRVKTWQLVLILVLGIIVTATFLRLNNIGMVERRTAVFAADKQGDANLIRSRLFDLQRYSAAHMNADSDTIYLQEQYNRDVQSSVTKATANNHTDNINVKANQICRQRVGGYSQAWIQCFTEELAKYPANYYSDQKAQLPNPVLYSHTFSSPLWSPDFAGFSVLICLLLMAVIVTRLLSLALLRFLLRRHFKTI
jgi:hypothetical protein